MYLFILEDGEVIHLEDHTDSERASADDGIADLIDISDPKAPKQYYDGEWHDIQVIQK